MERANDANEADRLRKAEASSALARFVIVGNERSASSQKEKTTLAHDERDAAFSLPESALERHSAMFWRSFTLLDEPWVQRLQRLNDTVRWQDERSKRLSLLELALQTPRFWANEESRPFALVRFRSAASCAMFFVGPECYRPASSNEYGYAPDTAFEVAAKLLYGDKKPLSTRDPSVTERESTAIGDLTFLWTLQAAEGNLSPVVAAAFEKTTTRVLPDDRLVWELWSPGLHPAIERGLQHLHFLVACAASDYRACLETLATCGIRCETDAQDALVRRCRGCIKESLVAEAFAERDVSIVLQTEKWQFRCRNVSLTFSDGRTWHETTFHRVRWLAAWAACIATFGIEPILARTPDCMVMAFARRELR